MNAWLQLLHAALDLLKRPWKAMLALLTLSLVGLFSAYSRNDPWLQSHRTMLWGCSLFASFYLIAAVSEWGGRRVWIWRYLQRLAPDERNVVRSFIDSHLRTRALISSMATAEAMVKLGILEMRDRTLNRGRSANEIFFTMHPWIFRYLEKRPHLYATDNPFMA
jgi:hypothetical protein